MSWKGLIAKKTLLQLLTIELGVDELITASIPTASFELGRLELQKSPIYEKMSEEEQCYYINRSLEMGKQAAKKMQEQQKTIFQLIEEQQICLIKKKVSKYTGDFILRGDIHFTPSKCEITVYEDSLQSIYKEADGSLPKAMVLTSKQALAVHLSHEFFHYLEFQSGKTISERLDKLQVPGIFGRIRRVEVLACSEIAAHAFAKQFCQLKVLPNYYDLHYLYQKMS